MLSRQPPTIPFSTPLALPRSQRPLPIGKLVYHGRDPAMLAGAADIAVVPSQVVLVHRVARNFSGKAGARPRFGVRQVLRPGPGRLKSEPVGILVGHLGLHRLIGAEGAGRTAPDFIPGWKRCRIGVASWVAEWKRLIKIRAPGELIPPVGNIGDTQRRVSEKLAFDRQVPLDAVRVFLVPLIRGEESLRTEAGAVGAYSGHRGTGKTPGRQTPTFEKLPWKPSWIPATEKNTAPKVVTS